MRVLSRVSPTLAIPYTVQSKVEMRSMDCFLGFRVQVRVLSRVLPALAVGSPVKMRGIDSRGIVSHQQYSRHPTFQNFGSLDKPEDF